MFRFTHFRIVALFMMFALFVAANVQAQCNSGVSTQNAQVAANQQLVLQQTAAIAAQQQAQQIRTVTSSRQVTTGQLPLSLGQNTCTSCQNQTQLAIAHGTARGNPQAASVRPQVAAAPKPAPAPPAMMFVRMTPSQSQKPAAESARYVLMSGKVPSESLRLASR